MAGARKNADDHLALKLAAGEEVRSAAGALGIPERTAFRRAAEPSFQARVRDLRGRMIDRAAGRLAAMMVSATEVLQDVLEGRIIGREAGVRLPAAQAAIELPLRVIELNELQQRVAEIEERLNREKKS